MSPTSTLTQYQTSQEATETPFTITKEAVVKAIHDEANTKDAVCTYQIAEAIYEMLKAAAERALAVPKNNQILHHLSDEEILDLHPVLDVVMIDDNTTPADGSAHALINAHFLPVGTHVLVHTKAGERLQHCAVAIKSRAV
jgi:hypothetical protein